jgi:hypothetical protein
MANLKRRGYPVNEDTRRQIYRAFGELGIKTPGKQKLEIDFRLPASHHDAKSAA